MSLPASEIVAAGLSEHPEDELIRVEREAAQKKKRSGWSRYTLTDKQGRTATVGVCVKCRNRRGERGKHGREALVYAYGGGLVPGSYRWVKETYRTRFAIETTYRQLGQARIRTSTPGRLADYPVTAGVTPLNTCTKRARSILPPLITATVLRAAGSSAARKRKAANATAPLGSATIFASVASTRSRRM